MKDSGRPRKLEPGLDHRYSKCSDFRTSTIKSEPGRSVIIPAGVSETSAGSAGGEAMAICVCCAWAARAPATSAAALPAAIFRKLRRSLEVRAGEGLSGELFSDFFAMAMLPPFQKVW